MARNTSITGSNNFRWTIGDSTTSTYVDKPILKEFYGDSRCSDEFVTFFDLINIGTFTNFGFLNLQPTNIESFINYISEHFKWMDRKLKNQNPDIPNPEPSNGFYWYAGTTLPTASNISTIARGSLTSKPSWTASNQQDCTVTNNTGASSYIYYCFPANWNVTFYDGNNFNIGLASESSFTYNNVEYKVERLGRKQVAGATIPLFARC